MSYAAGGRARIIVLPESAPDSRERDQDYFTNSLVLPMNLNLLSSFSRMFPDCSLPTEEEISGEFSWNFSGSGIVEHGELLMLNTSEWPSVEEGSSVCSLAEILEPQVAPKYFLSVKACSGILRREGKRGKKLPAQLEEALKVGASAQPT